jgi:hypothetical protein
MASAGMTAMACEPSSSPLAYGARVSGAHIEEAGCSRIATNRHCHECTHRHLLCLREWHREHFHQPRIGGHPGSAHPCEALRFHTCGATREGDAAVF